MAARLIQRASRLLAVPVSFQPTFVPSECVRSAQLAPSLPCQAAALHISPLCRLAESLPEVSPAPPTQDDDNAFFSMLQDLPGVEELLDVACKKKLNGNRLVMVLQQITRRASEKKQTVLDNPRLQDLLKDINSQIEYVWNVRLIRLLKCLYALGLSRDDFTLQSAEIEVRWRLRRLSIGTLSFLSSFIAQEPRDQKSLFNELVKEVELRWTEIKDVRSLVTITSRLGGVSESLMEKLEDKILEFAQNFTPEESRRVIALLASRRRRTLSVLQALSFHLLRHKLELSQSVVVDLAVAYGKLNFCHPQVLQKMATDIIPKLPDAKPLEMALMIRAYSSLKFSSPPLCEAIAQECVKRRESFGSHLCTILLSFAHLNFQPGSNEEFFSTIYQWLDSDFDSLTWNQQLEAVWSLCVLSRVTPPYLQKVLEPQFYIQILEDSSPKSGSHYLKLMQINATALLESPGYEGPLLPSKVLTTMQQKIKWKSTKELQTAATTVLKSIFPAEGTCNFTVPTIYGVHLDCEVILDPQFTALPIKEVVAPHNPQNGGTQPLPEGSRRIAIITREFSQYLFRRKELLGQFMMNQRHLQAVGFLVVEVPYYEWQEIKSDWQKQYFLKEQIKKVVATEDSGL